MTKATQHRIKELRTQAGLSQQSLADQIGVRCKTISDWERGIHRISTDNAKKLSQFFQISMDDLLDN
ncbi:helix-turn-helix transcriptional regulator [Streptococcus uberis]|uniref:helix-turn-helix transcriptional regulator n=1 Tax=Streptococcus uberis TaxID=1349 RepID=UPI001FF1D635|nr:helix-turn-helix domain-containing protein [Streptococcus uberis]